MERTLELLESTVSPRTRWHFLVLTDGSGRAVGECSDSGDALALAAWLERCASELAGRDLVADRAELWPGSATGGVDRAAAAPDRGDGARRARAAPPRPVSRDGRANRSGSG